MKIKSIEFLKLQSCQQITNLTKQRKPSKEKAYNPDKILCLVIVRASP